MMRRRGDPMLLAALATALLLATACRDSVSVRPPLTAALSDTAGTAVRITGDGQIGELSLTYGSSYDTFEFDVLSDLTGKLVYTEYGLRVDGPVVQLTVDPSDSETGITAFKPSSTVCADSARGVEFDGVSRENINQDPRNVGALVIFHAAACDNGPDGSGLDYFRFDVPGVGYSHSGFLTSGDITKSTF